MPGWVPALTSTGSGPSGVGTSDARAERRLADRDGQLVVELRVLAPQLGVRRHVDHHVEVAGRPAARPGLALAGEADLVAVIDAGGDRHAERPLALDPPVAPARTARLLDDAPGPRQRGHAVTLTIWPSIVERTERCSPVPLHCGHVIGSVPGSAPVPEHVSHRVYAVNSMSFSAPWIASSNVSRRS